MRLHPKFGFALASALLFWLAPTITSADSIYSNFSPGYTDSGNAVNVAGDNYGGEYYAVSFTPANTITFTQAITDLLLFTGNQTIDASLLADDNGLPGTAFMTLEQSSLVGNGIVGFTCSSACPTLEGGTQYWLELQETDPNTAIGWYLSSTDHTNGEDEALRYTYYGPNSSFYWPSDYRNVFEIEGTPVGDPSPLGTTPIDPAPVPEPGTANLFFTGLIFLVGPARAKWRARFRASHGNNLAN